MSIPSKFETGCKKAASATFLDALKADKPFVHDASRVVGIVLVSMLTLMLFAWLDWAHAVTDFNARRFIRFMILVSSLTMAIGLMAFVIRLLDEWLWYKVGQLESSRISQKMNNHRIRILLMKVHVSRFTRGNSRQKSPYP